jgi:hypothetical protein
MYIKFENAFGIGTAGADPGVQVRGGGALK